MEALSNSLVEEIVGKKIDCECCVVSFLSGFVLARGEFLIRNKKPCIMLKPAHKQAMQYIESIIEKSYGKDVVKNAVIDENISEKILQNCGFLSPHGELELQVGNDIFACEECCGAFLRGAYLACGRANINIGSDLTASTGSGYKIIFNMSSTAESEFAQILAETGIDVSAVDGSIYIMGFENVRTFLLAVGANKNLLMLENENIARDLRSQSNRAVNAAENNIKKSIAFGAELLAAVKTIDEIIGINKLPPHIKELCRLVLTSENVSLPALAQKLNISKSGANHRVRSVREIYKTLS